MYITLNMVRAMCLYWILCTSEIFPHVAISEKVMRGRCGLFSRSSGIKPKTSRPARVLSVTSGLVSLLRKRFLVFLSGGIWYPRQNFLITARQASWHTPRPLTGKSLSNTSGLAGSSSKMVSVPNGYSRNLVRNDAKLNLFSKCKKTLKVKVP